MRSKNPDIVASEKALRRATRRALEIGIKTGTPVYVVKRGKIVDLTQRDAAGLLPLLRAPPVLLWHKRGRLPDLLLAKPGK